MSMAYALTDSRVMVTRCVRRSLRDPEAFFTALMLPVVLMLMFVYVFGGAFSAGGTYANYVVPGLIVLCAGFGAGTTAVAVATDMGNGIVDRFRSMPIADPWSWSATSRPAWPATSSRPPSSSAWAWRWAGAHGGRGRLAEAAAMIVFFVLALSWLAAAVGLLAGSAEAANSFTFVLMFLPYVSTAFVPARTLPGWMRGFAAHQPFTPIVETMRGLWMGHTSTGAAVGHEAWIACAWCTGILVVSSRRLPGCSSTGPPPEREDARTAERRRTPGGRRRRSGARSRAQVLDRVAASGEALGGHPHRSSSASVPSAPENGGG